MPKNEATPEPEQVDELVRWSEVEGAGEHVMKTKTSTACGLKGVVEVVNIGTLPPDRRPPCQGCADKTN